MGLGTRIVHRRTAGRVGVGIFLVVLGGSSGRSSAQDVVPPFTGAQAPAGPSAAILRTPVTSDGLEALPANSTFQDGQPPSGRPTPDSSARRAPAPPAQAQAESQAALSLFERQLQAYSDPLSNQPVLQFGYEVFGKLLPSSADVPVGADYVLGVGDNIIISLWGSVDIDHRATLNREGEVRLPQIGPVPLKGLTLRRAEEELKRRFDRELKNYELQVRLGRLRDMQVHVVGRVVSPGRVRVPSVATLFDALAAAGGITKEGTLRKVLLRHAGSPDRAIDLYAYLIDGDLSVDVSLSADDAIVVPPVGPRVAIVGRVLRPAIYEIEAEPVTFQALLAMAGGFARLADRKVLQIESVNTTGLSIWKVDLEATPAPSVLLLDGAVAVVGNASPKIENVVYVAGNVALPGRYAFKDGMRVADVVTSETLVEAGFWMREGLPTTASEEGKRVFGARPAPPPPRTRPGAEPPAEKGRSKADASGESGGEAAQQALKALARSGATPTSLVESREQVAEKAEQEKSETKADPFLEYPEPFLEYALIRRIDPQTRQERRIAFNLGKAIFEKNPGENLPLQSQDTIVVFPRSAFEARRTVQLTGAVHQPGEHRYFEGMRVLDLIRMAGGLLPEAHLASGVLTRIDSDQTGARFSHIPIDLGAALSGDEKANLTLKPDDALAVKVVPDYRKTFRAKVEGEVRQPGTYTLIPGERLSDLIQRAGGLTGEAYLPAAQFYRESVRELQQDRIDESLKRLETESKLAAQRYAAEAAATGETATDAKAELTRVERLVSTLATARAKGRMVIRIQSPEKLVGTPDDVELSESDVLVIPRRPQEVHVVGAVFNQTALVYQPNLRARDYLAECGGATDSAEMSLAYVIRADGSADGAQGVRRNYQWDGSRGRYTRSDLMGSDLYPGDTLVIPYDVKPQLSKLGLTKTVTEILFHAALATGVVIALL
jgi:polysaccharide biosynthesis/export protein